MNSRKRDARSVDTVVADIIRANGWEVQLEMYSLFGRWVDLVSTEVSAHSRPVRIDRDCLWLEVENSAWMTQFQYEKYGILDILNAALRLGRLRDLKMTLPKKERVFMPMKRPAPRVTYKPPSEEETERFHKKLVGVITDDACRESLEYFWYLSHACRREDEM